MATVFPVYITGSQYIRCLAILVCVAGPLWGFSSEYDFLSDNSGLTRHTLTFSYPAGNAFLRESMSGGKHDAFRWGVSVDALSLGMISPQGLLRDIDSPFKGGTSDFWKNGSPRYLPSLTAGSGNLLGIAFHPALTPMGWFILKAKEKGYRGGVFASVDPLPGVEAYACARLSFSGKATLEYNEKGWMLDCPSPYGGTLFHCAMGTSMRGDRWLWGFNCGVSAAMDILPGFFIRTSSRFSGESLSLLIGGTWADEEYRTGDGVVLDDVGKVLARIDGRFADSCSWKLSGTGYLDRPSLISWESRAAQWECAGSVTVRISECRITAGVEMGWDAEWYGSPAESFTVSRDTGLAELRLSPGGRWPEVSWEIKESDGSIRHSAVLIAAGETGMNESVVGNEFFRNGEWLVRVGVRGPEPAELTARCAVILAIPSGSFRFTAGTGGWIDIDGLRESLKEDLELSFSYTTGSVEDQR